MISLLWKKKIVEKWKWKMGWVWVFFFFKALIVDGGEGRGLLQFLQIFYFHVYNFLGCFTLQGGERGKVGRGAFLIKNHFLFL